MQNTSFEDVEGYIRSINSTSELQKISKIISARHKELQRHMATKFSVGDKVTFSGKYGNVESGKIIKINQKSIDVRTLTNRWRVSPSMLSKVD